MARERQGATEDTTAVPGQRSEPAPRDAGADDAGRVPVSPGEGEAAPAGPVASAAATATPDASAPPETSSPEASSPEAPSPEAPSPEAGGTAEPEAPHPGKPDELKIRHTRLSGTWAAVVAFTVVLLLLLIFILQNLSSVEVSYFGAHGHLPLGVGLLLAAVAGILLVALAGSARIMQLRATARKHRRADRKVAKAQAKQAKQAAKARR